MQNEERPSFSYAFDSDEPNSYVFRTINQVLYEVRFRPSGYIFEHDPDLQPFVFEISIIVIDNPSGKRPPTDSMVSSTIALIFGRFFEQHHRVVVYICDTSDRRGYARHRKFTSWLERYKSNYMQVSDSLTDKDGVVYFGSLIVGRNNPYRGRIMVAFSDLFVGLASEK